MVVKLMKTPVHVNVPALGCFSLVVNAISSIEVKTVPNADSLDVVLVVNLTGKNAAVPVNQVLVEEIVIVSYFLTLFSISLQTYFD